MKALKKNLLLTTLFTLLLSGCSNNLNLNEQMYEGSKIEPNLQSIFPSQTNLFQSDTILVRPDFLPLHSESNSIITAAVALPEDSLGQTFTFTGTLKGEDNHFWMSYNEGSRSCVSIGLTIPQNYLDDFNKYIGYDLQITGKLTKLGIWNKTIDVEYYLVTNFFNNVNINPIKPISFDIISLNPITSAVELSEDSIGKTFTFSGTLKENNGFYWMNFNEASRSKVTIYLDVPSELQLSMQNNIGKTVKITGILTKPGIWTKYIEVTKIN